MRKRTIALGSDHAGFRVKEIARNVLARMGIPVVDFGTDSESSVDYPDYARRAVEAVLDGRADRALLVCGSGIGMSIAANKYPGIRAALVSEPRMAELSRRHNDANVLVLPGWKLSAEEVGEIVRVWLETEFEGGRHQRRLEKISAIERRVLERCGPGESGASGPGESGKERL